VAVGKGAGFGAARPAIRTIARNEDRRRSADVVVRGGFRVAELRVHRATLLLPAGPGLGFVESRDGHKPARIEAGQRRVDQILRPHGRLGGLLRRISGNVPELCRGGGGQRHAGRWTLAHVTLLFTTIIFLRAAAEVGPKLSNFFRFLGMLSYPLYLLQSPVLRVGEEVLKREHFGPGGSLVFAVVEAAAALTISSLALTYYDVPLRRLFRARVARRRPALATRSEGRSGQLAASPNACATRCSTGTTDEASN
jgi:hypothetical protein